MKRGKATHDDAPRRHTLRELLGGDMVQACVATRESEWVALKGMSLEMGAALLFDKSLD